MTGSIRSNTVGKNSNQENQKKPVLREVSFFYKLQKLSDDFINDHPGTKIFAIYFNICPLEEE